MMKQPLLTSAKTSARFCATHRLRGLGLALLLPLMTHAQTGEKMSAVEIVGPGKASVAARGLVALCRKYRVPTAGVGSWRNHLVAYGPTERVRAVRQNLAALYPTAAVNFYAVPFYKFDRQHCAGNASSQAWDNILLTANLVPDERKQREYLQHHATQFRRWPEVAQGFCNASFQQLLVFRQGRQLLLVISIPHGASLAELNPKTSLHNPRVNDWNQLMKQYQQGLPGAKPGETWVFLQPVAAKQAVSVEK